jgi:glutathione reductase (NADPH)
VAIAEEYRFGGTCVIRGCVPKKLLVYASRFRDEFEDAAGFGWSVEERSFDWPTLIANKDAEIARLEGLYRAGLERAGSPSCRPAPSLPTRTRLVCAAGRPQDHGRTFWSQPAGRPVVPDTPGAGHAITSNEAFHLESLPKSILIVGGGYIAVEFACIFNGLGVDTTLLYRGPKILRGFDEELRDSLTKELFKREIDGAVQCRDRGHREGPVALQGDAEGRQRVDTGLVMLATGRIPNTAGIGLEGPA